MGSKRLEADPKLKEWSSEYRAINKKLRTVEADVSKLLSVCKASDLKVAVTKMIEQSNYADLNLRHEDDQTLQDIESIKKKVKLFKLALQSEVKDEAYFMAAESQAEAIEQMIGDFKNRYGEVYANLEAEYEDITGDLSRLEANLKVYEEKINITEEELDNIRRFGRGTMEQGEEQQNALANEKKDLDFKQIEMVEDIYKQRNQLGHDYREVIEKIKLSRLAIEEVNSLMELNGGLTCGWSSSKDHEEYCRLRIRHQGRVESIPFFDECKIVLPLYTREQIQEHSIHYNKYLKLEARRKEELGKYKKYKEEMKKLEAQYRAQLLVAEEKNKRVDPEIEKIEKLRKKEEIERWKREREVDKVIALEKQDEAVLHQIKQMELKRKKELEEKKRLVQEFREKKEIEKAMEFQREAAKDSMKKYVSLEQKARIREKEDALIEKKKQVINEKKAKEAELKLKLEIQMIEKHKKLEKVKPRLHEDTRLVFDRKREKFDPTKDEAKRADSFGGTMLRTTGRAIVGWMK